MIPKEFKSTSKLHKELISLEEEEEKAIFKVENSEIAHYIDDEYLEYQKEIYESDTQERYKKQIADSFTKEYKKLNKSNKYFLGCSLMNYNHNYDNRLSEYREKYTDAIEHNFIYEELQNINKFNLPYYIDNDVKKSIYFSIERIKEVLKKKLSDNGYEISTSYNDAGEINSLAIKGFSVLKINEEPIIDLSDSKGTEKVLYLGLIGFFEYIKKREPQLNNNQIAILISGITGEKYDTIKSYIYPILSTTKTSQKNNPFDKEKSVTKIKNKLYDLGIETFETIR